VEPAQLAVGEFGGQVDGGPGTQGCVQARAAVEGEFLVVVGEGDDAGGQGGVDGCCVEIDRGDDGLEPNHGAPGRRGRRLPISGLVPGVAVVVGAAVGAAPASPSSAATARSAVAVGVLGEGVDGAPFEEGDLGGVVEEGADGSGAGVEGLVLEDVAQVCDLDSDGRGLGDQRDRVVGGQGEVEGETAELVGDAAGGWPAGLVGAGGTCDEVGGRDLDGLGLGCGSSGLGGSGEVLVLGESDLAVERAVGRDDERHRLGVADGAVVGVESDELAEGELAGDAPCVEGLPAPEVVRVVRGVRQRRDRVGCGAWCGAAGGGLRSLGVLGLRFLGVACLGRGGAADGGPLTLQPVRGRRGNFCLVQALVVRTFDVGGGAWRGLVRTVLTPGLTPVLAGLLTGGGGREVLAGAGCLFCGAGCLVCGAGHVAHPPERDGGPLVSVLGGPVGAAVSTCTYCALFEQSNCLRLYSLVERFPESF
jgi:hypothetical protein